MKKIVNHSRTIHTRKLDRSVARHAMKKAGITNINKRYRGDRHSSFFSRHWREYFLQGGV